MNKIIATVSLIVGVYASNAQTVPRATFTINGKSYTCDEVNAIGYKNDNKLEINANKSDSDENIFFSFSLKNIGKGQQKFNTTGYRNQFHNTGDNVYKYL